MVPSSMKGTAFFVEGRVNEDSIWSVLHRECHRLFPDEMFADLFDVRGRRSVPPSGLPVAQAGTQPSVCCRWWLRPRLALA